VAAVAVGALMTVGALRVTAPRWPPDGWRLVACDVGQGDGLVLRTGRNDAVVVDTGPEPEAIRRCLDRLGITRVPLLILTHLHADHEGGARGVLEHRTTGTVVTTSLRGPPEEWRDLHEAARAAGKTVETVSAGVSWHIGELDLQVIWPPRSDPTVTDDSAGEESSAENDASVVMRASWPGTTALLTGDIEPAVQAELLAAGADLRADVLKVPHHGSPRQDHRFLAATGARLALVSAGVDNDYGHPAPRTLDALTSRGTRVARTDLDGDLDRK